MPAGIRKRKLEYGDVTGHNLLAHMSNLGHLHTWVEEIQGRTLIVGYMFPEEVPGVRLAPPEEKKVKEKQRDGGMFTTTTPDPFPPLPEESSSDTATDRARDAALRDIPR